MKRLRSSILSIGLLTLFLTYEVSLTMFAHVHVVNGFHLVHSHPSSKRHTHPLTQLVTIAYLQAFHAEEALPTFSIQPLQVLLYEAEIPLRTAISLATPHYNYSLRAPPISC
ncbi:MAG: hypothetical protein ACRCZY_05750 [Phocaeicola sp.]